MNVNIQAVGNQTLKLIFKQKAVIAILLILFVMLFSDTNFYTWLNIRNVFSAASPNLIIAFGVTFAVLCRGCDLSVGSVMALSSILTVMMVNSGMNLYLAIILAILSGTVIGFINGFLIVHQKTEAFITTLGMGMLIKGIALYLTDGNPVPARNLDLMMIANGTFFSGIPNMILFMLILCALAFYMLRFTSFGRSIYALGGDYEVAKQSGINVIATKWGAFTLSGTFAAIAGVLISSRLSTGPAIYGDAVPLMVHSGIVIGGTSFAGGTGGIVCSFVGIMVMELLRNCMNAFAINRFVQTLILGTVIVSVIAMDCFVIKRKKSSRQTD